ncbi:MAG: winged helix-turn-helix domain-containing protein [Haloarculaceae archaeon]
MSSGTESGRVGVGTGDIDAGSDGPVGDIDAAAETFALLSDETRVRILVALAEAAGGLRFSELRTRVGVRDAGRFNYHLEKLRGRLVEKSGETYVLTAAGADVATLL